MKRMIALLLALLVVFSLAACGQERVGEHHELIRSATAELKSHWKQYYKETDLDGYFEIKNTRVITLKDNEIELFADVAYIVEFELYTDWFGSAPYYCNATTNDNVVVYKDGSMAVTDSLIRQYRNRYYQADFSGFIAEIDDYQGAYNCIEKLK